MSVEGDAAVNRKVHAALAHDLTPIVCVGENLAQNEAGQTHAFVGGQVRAALAGLTGEQARRCVIAYEPLWAIGTGRAATHRPHRPRRHRRDVRGKHRPGHAGPVRRQRCHLSGYTGPWIFTHSGQVIFTQTGPSVFTQAGPLIFAQNGP